MRACLLSGSYSPHGDGTAWLDVSCCGVMLGATLLSGEIACDVCSGQDLQDEVVHAYVKHILLCCA